MNVSEIIGNKHQNYGTRNDTLVRLSTIPDIRQSLIFCIEYITGFPRSRQDLKFSGSSYPLWTEDARINSFHKENWEIF